MEDIYRMNGAMTEEQSMKTEIMRGVAAVVIFSLLTPVALNPATGAPELYSRDTGTDEIVKKFASNEAPAEMNIILPSNAVIGKPVKAVLQTLDNRSKITRRGLDGTSFSSTDANANLSILSGLKSINGGVITIEDAVVFNTPGIHYVIVENRERGIRSVSNPVMVTEKEPEYKWYWGEIHDQTWFSDGWYTTVGTSPDMAYRYYRDVAGLDFAAVTDHDACWEGVLQTPFGVIGNWFTDDFMKRYGWEHEKEATRNNYVDEQFVTLLAQEWTQDYEAYNTYGDGHYNVYYNCVDEADFYSCLDKQTNRIYEMFDALRGWKNDTGKDVFMIPHHLQHPTLGWDYHYYDEELVPLVEICQVRGSSEMRNELGNPVQFSGAMKEPGHTVQDALAMGYRLGFVASTDDHAIAETETSKACITGVMAEDLTRDGIFNALKDRRCIAAKGGHTRMLIDFKVNGQTVGGSSVVKVPGADSPRTIECSVAGTAPLTSVALIKNNETLYSIDIQGNEQDLSTYQANFSFTDVQPVTGTTWSASEYNSFKGGTNGEDYYYIRVLQSDGCAGWIGPIWVEAEK